MMKDKIKHIIILIFIVVLVLLIPFVYNNTGTFKSNIEKDARFSQQISSTWEVAKDTTKTMSAMVFYDKELSDYTASIYVNPEGFSFGYFFRYGGTVGDEITEVHIDGYNECAYISKNEQQVCKVEVDNGIEVKTIEIDSKKPFAFILPVNARHVTIYDINGNIIKSVKVIG